MAANRVQVRRLRRQRFSPPVKFVGAAHASGPTSLKMTGPNPCNAGPSPRSGCSLFVTVSEVASVVWCHGVLFFFLRQRRRRTILLSKQDPVNLPSHRSTHPPRSVSYSPTFTSPLVRSVVLAKMGNKVSLEENMIDLRIVSKQMARSALKCEKNEKAALAKLKKVCVYIYIYTAHASNS